MEEEFFQWVKDLTRGTPYGNINSVSNDFSKFLKAKSLHPALKYLIEHLRPASERRHIRLNLKHAAIRKRLLEDKDISANHRRHASLSSLLQDTKAAISMDAKELHNIAEEEELLLLKERELKRKISLAKEAIISKENSLKTFRAWNEDIPLLLPKYSKPSSNPQENSIQEDSLKENLQFILKRLKEFRKNMLESKKEDQHKEKAQIWELVEKLQTQYSPDAILKVLCSISVSCTSAVDKLTAEVDIVKDAKSLRIKQESSGTFIDELDDHGELETVQMLLIQMSGNHIKMHLNNYSLMQEIKLTSAALDTVKRNISAVVKEVYDDESLVPEVMMLLEESVRLAGTKAAVSKASSLTRELDRRSESARRAQNILLNKYSKIHLFDNKVKKGVFQLKCLASSASDSMKSLEKLLNDILLIVERETSRISVPIPYVSNIISNELDAFLLLPFEILHTFETDQKPVTVSSIGPLQCYNKKPDLKVKIGPTLSNLTPVITTWDHLVEIFRQKKVQLKHLEEVVITKKMYLEDMIETSRNQKISASFVNELCSKLKEKDLVLEEKVVLLLMACEEMNRKNQTQLQQVESVINDWWVQPAQNIKDILY